MEFRAGCLRSPGMGRFILFAAVLSMLVSRGGGAYVETKTESGITVKWAAGGAYYMLAGNPQNRSGIPEDYFRRAVIKGLQRWQTASGNMVTFDYWQGTDRAKYLTNSDYNGFSNIYFASNSGSGISSNVLALTQVWYNTGNGEILEADIALNDINYNFGTNPGVTTSNGGGTAFLDNVITHELGHSFGLSHSGIMQSTMIYTEAYEQYLLGCDDQIGMRALYPAGDAGSRSRIMGSVVAESGGGAVAGAHVLAVSALRGTVMASAMAGNDGRFELRALESGPYFLMVEPYYPGAGSLSAYFGGVNHRICSGGSFFARSPVVSGGRMQAFSASAGGTADVGTLAVRCTTDGGADVDRIQASGSAGSAPVVFDGTGGSGSFGVIDDFDGRQSIYFRLKSVSGSIRLNTVAFGAYSPIHPSLKLYTSGGAEVAAGVAETVYSGASGYINYDSSLSATVSKGDYVVRVTANSLYSSLYPGGAISLDSRRFVILTGVTGGLSPQLVDAHPHNARCTRGDIFPAYDSPYGDPPKNTHGASSDEEDDGGGFCGVISENHRGGLPPGAVAGWFAPWVLMLMMAYAAARMARISGVARRTLRG